MSEQDLAAIQATVDGTYLVQRVADVFETHEDLRNSLEKLGLEDFGM